jgi:hypothetical protein
MPARAPPDRQNHGGLQQECDGVAGREGSRTNQANAEFDNLERQATV